MKALTIRQPHASSIFLLGKDVENRTWPTNYRGPLIIHAGLKYNPQDFDNLNIKNFDLCWGRGVLLGLVDLVDCVKDYNSIWAEKGYYHWVLKNPVKFKDTIIARGRLGIWETNIKSIYNGLIRKQKV